ncbi:MAG: hypothetical protein OXB92_11485, partial [Acidimicrobiaceae bacterium]|nr:hypothetical protein [Acidimicrobiaceae bacterium]
TKTISAGIANGTWVYYDPQADRAWGRDDPPPAVRSAPDTMLYTPARAAELNLLRKRVDWSAISTVLTASGGPFDGASLRRELTAGLARETPEGGVVWGPPLRRGAPPPNPRSRDFPPPPPGARS